VTATPVMPTQGGGGRRRRRFTGRKRLVAVALAVIAGAFVAGWLPRHLARLRAARLATLEQAPRRVPVVKATAEGSGRELTLPGGLVAIQHTLIYARASGYVRTWLVDIGDHVHTGQIIAELDTPDLDQQLAQARATLAQREAALVQAEATQQLAHISAKRQNFLVVRKLVAQQDADDANTQAAVADANVASARADIRAQRDAVRQLEDLVAFARVTAPFDGTVTKRLIEVGSLVNAGATTAAQALFEIEATDPLRVFVEVPQTFAPSIRVGASADVVLPQYPGRKFQGKVTRTAGALEPASRALRTEIVVPNGSGELLPGMYCEVTLPVAVSHPIVRIPQSAIVYDARGVHVAAVGNDKVVHLITVQQGRNLGDEVEIVNGLVGDERILSAPPADVTDGMRVEPVGG
jgi:membrane fusion protein (multidrug efflux system)